MEGSQRLFRAKREPYYSKNGTTRSAAFFATASLSVVRYNEPTVRNKRASYNGSIEASQASDVGSIPIARSINLVDSVALPLLRLKKGANWAEFWTQLAPN